MASKAESIEAMAKAATKSELAARKIANPERRAKALALAEQIQARTQDLQKTVRTPTRSIRRRQERDQDLER